MGRRKSKNSRADWTKKMKTETLNPEPHPQDADDGDADGVNELGGGNRFYACYLLTSLCPRFKGFTYIGFTVNPRRRIRQHNGELTMGAWKTKKRRPWEMVLCVYGFPTNVSALQFEWAWQHPMESKAVREAAAKFKSFSGVANKVKLAYTMLALPLWQSLNLTVNYFSTKHMNSSTGSLSLPKQMKVQVCPMDELPCYDDNWSFDDGEEDGDDDDYRLCGGNEDKNVSDLSGSSAEGNVFDGGDDGKELSIVRCDKQLGDGEDDKVCSDLNVEEPYIYDEYYFAGDCGGIIDWTHSSCSSPNTEVDDRMHTLNGSPVRRISPIRSELLSVGEMSNESNVLVMISGGSDSKFCSMKRKEVSGEDAAAYCPANFSSQIEVIDLLSPSPELRRCSISKKGRFADAVTPQIIDLT
ncbi:Structure-specific endonuclease subunit SLX1 [Linum grandiflorum]